MADREVATGHDAAVAYPMVRIERFDKLPDDWAKGHPRPQHDTLVTAEEAAEFERRCAEWALSIDSLGRQPLRPLDAFHTLDHHANEYVIEHGNVAIDGPTRVTLWPLAMWRAEKEARRD